MQRKKGEGGAKVGGRTQRGVLSRKGEVRLLMQYDSGYCLDFRSAIRARAISPSLLSG